VSKHQVTERDKHKAPASSNLIGQKVVFSPNVKVPPIGGPGFRFETLLQHSRVLDFKTGKMKERLPLAQQCDQSARDVAIYLRDVEHVDAVSITAQWTQPEQPARDTKVLEIVINELPVPDDTHSIEDVLAFRDEMKEQNLIQGLRVWMNEVAAGKLQPSEISTKLDFLIHEYARALDLNRMKRRNLMLRRLLVTPVEVLEDLVKFKWKDLASIAFEFREKNIAFREEESKLAGRGRVHRESSGEVLRTEECQDFLREIRALCALNA
jgi:hypothetical protein